MILCLPLASSNNMAPQFWVLNYNNKVLESTDLLVEVKNLHIRRLKIKTQTFIFNLCGFYWKVPTIYPDPTLSRLLTTIILFT